MEEQKKKMQLPKITRDEFFTTQEERDLLSKEHVENIKISDIADFPNHPFKVIVDNEMREMSKSIEEYGVLVPVLVRPKQDGKYEIISGHRRKKASELANKDSIPCIIRELTDDEVIQIYTKLSKQEMEWNTYRLEEEEKWKMKMEEGILEGRKEGIQQASIEIAKSLLKKGMNIEDILEVTDLTKEQLDSI